MQVFPPSRGPRQPQSCACVHSQRFKHGMCVHVLVCLAAPILAERLCATRESEESNGRERQIAHTQITHIITHTHAAAEWVHSTTKSKRKTKQKAEAWDEQRTHTLIAPVKQNTHTQREREVAHSMQ
ncbi:hypothetical protein TCDM_12603 [Trypanosoma cruzi Dm28c]|uniref:SWIM-type domain-containing protein n=1 Tax=Trypanosoma cruzi Dm28c TaxID=1416333 RepID=V5AKX0_TRYCR|nr:hypothetical protein TCDM_12603 [Trypanosoma cruzi Dm28c]